MPRVGSSMIKIDGLRHQPLGDDDFLLVAAAQALGRVAIDRAALDLERRRRPRAPPRSSPRGCTNWVMRLGELRQRDQRDIIRDGDLHQQAFFAAVLGDKGDLIVDAVARGGAMAVAIVDQHFALLRIHPARR